MIGQVTAVYMKQGKTLAEAKRNLREALVMVLEANRALAHRTHDHRATEEPISVAVE